MRINLDLLFAASSAAIFIGFLRAIAAQIPETPATAGNSWSAINALPDEYSSTDGVTDGTAQVTELLASAAELQQWSTDAASYYSSPATNRLDNNSHQAVTESPNDLQSDASQPSSQEVFSDTQPAVDSTQISESEASLTEEPTLETQATFQSTLTDNDSNSVTDADTSQPVSETLSAASVQSTSAFSTFDASSFSFESGSNAVTNAGTTVAGAYTDSAASDSQSTDATFYQRTDDTGFLSSTGAYASPETTNEAAFTQAPQTTASDHSAGELQNTESALLLAATQQTDRPEEMCSLAGRISTAFAWLQSKEVETAVCPCPNDLTNANSNNTCRYDNAYRLRIHLTKFQCQGETSSITLVNPSYADVSSKEFREIATLLLYGLYTMEQNSSTSGMRTICIAQVPMTATMYADAIYTMLSNSETEGVDVIKSVNSYLSTNGNRLGLSGLVADEIADIDECQTNGANECPASTSSCENTVGSYTCSCQHGYANAAADSQRPGTVCKELCIEGFRIASTCLSSYTTILLYVLLGLAIFLLLLLIILALIVCSAPANRPGDVQPIDYAKMDNDLATIPQPAQSQAAYAYNGPQIGNDYLPPGVAQSLKQPFY